MRTTSGFCRTPKWAASALLILVTTACSSSNPSAAPGASSSSTSVGSSSPATSTSVDQVPLPPSAHDLPGALAGLVGLRGPVSSSDRNRLVDAADGLVGMSARPSDPLSISSTEGPFVTDAQAAYTLALAGYVTGEERYSRTAAAIVGAWVSTARSTKNTCPDTGGCSTSLMVSRAAPALVFAVDVLRADGYYDDGALDRFHAWLRSVILPAASDRDNNWGDAGTYLRAVVGAELADREVMEGAAELWRQRLDMILPDGQIPEEMRRGDASLLYSQDALDYKVATADVLGRSGLDLWDVTGRRGGTLRVALELVATGLERPKRWPGGRGNLRVPDASGVWAMAAERWPGAAFARQADAAVTKDGTGHSAVIWTRLTHLKTS